MAKRGRLRKTLHAKARVTPGPIIIRIAVAGREPEPYRVRLNRVPEIGETFSAIPTRLARKIFARALTLRAVEMRDGVEIHVCE